MVPDNGIDVQVFMTWVEEKNVTAIAKNDSKGIKGVKLL